LEQLENKQPATATPPQTPEALRVSRLKPVARVDSPSATPESPKPEGLRITLRKTGSLKLDSTDMKDFIREAEKEKNQNPQQSVPEALAVGSKILDKLEQKRKETEEERKKIQEEMERREVEEQKKKAEMEKQLKEKQKEDLAKQLKEKEAQLKELKERKIQEEQKMVELKEKEEQQRKDMEIKTKLEQEKKKEDQKKKIGRR